MRVTNLEYILWNLYQSVLWKLYQSCSKFNINRWAFLTRFNLRDTKDKTSKEFTFFFYLGGHAPEKKHFPESKTTEIN